MVMCYVNLKQYPVAFAKLTGVEVGRFDSLLETVLPIYREAERRRCCRVDRQRAVGGGDRPQLDVRDQVLLAVIWLRLYPRQAILGDFFGVSQPTVWRILERVSLILQQAGWDSLARPDPGRKRRRDLEALLCEVPELLAVISGVITSCAGGPYALDP